jgi:hypothetical protein
MEGINKNVKPLLLGFKIDDDLRIASPKSQFVFKWSQERSGWTLYYLPLHCRDNYLFYMLHVCSLMDVQPRNPRPLRSAPVVQTPRQQPN